MPMEKIEDFALGRRDQDYCRYCTDEQGRLLSYAQILAMNANFYVESQGLTENAAQKMADECLRSQPAWRQQ
jgi:hypothetical protein